MQCWGMVPGLLGASLGFAVAHDADVARSAISLVNTAAAGALFGLLALRGGGIAVSTGAHFAWNWAETTLLGLDPNPGFDDFGAVFNFDIVGPPILGGSTEALNGSLVSILATGRSAHVAV